MDTSERYTDVTQYAPAVIKIICPFSTKDFHFEVTEPIKIMDVKILLMDLKPMAFIEYTDRIVSMKVEV